MVLGARTRPLRRHNEHPTGLYPVIGFRPPVQNGKQLGYTGALHPIKRRPRQCCIRRSRLSPGADPVRLEQGHPARDILLPSLIKPHPVTFQMLPRHLCRGLRQRLSNWVEQITGHEDSWRYRFADADTGQQTLSFWSLAQAALVIQQALSLQNQPIPGIGSVPPGLVRLCYEAKIELDGNFVVLQLAGAPVANQKIQLSQRSPLGLNLLILQYNVPT